MYLHELKPPRGSRKRRKIVGRGPGSGHGKTSTKGHKGQKARSGHGMNSSLEGGQVPLIRRLPKVGFRSKRPVINQIVNLGDLNRFEKGSMVNAETLRQKGLIKTLKKPFKILGDGELKMALTIQTRSISQSAHDKVVQAGGKIEILKKTDGDTVNKNE